MNFTGVGIPDFFETNLMLVFATLILVGVTAFYAIQTRKTVSAIEKSTEVSIIPFVKFSFVSFFYSNFCLELLNAGKGPAINVKASYTIKQGDNSKIEYECDILNVNQKEQFYLEIGGEIQTTLDYFKKNETIVETSVYFENVSGKKFSKTEEYWLFVHRDHTVQL